MRETSGKIKKGYTHPAFRGLTDRDLLSIYKTTNIRKVSSGNVLVEPGETHNTIHLLLDGTAQLLEGQGENFKKKSILKRGDAVSGDSFKNVGEKTASVVAKEPLKVITLSDREFDTLPSHIQSTVYRNLNSLSQRRLRVIAVEKTQLLGQYEHLAGRMAQLLEKNGEKYAESEMIRGILKGIPRLPMYANRLAVVILDENVSTRDVAELAKLDPSLVAVVLKTVNSSYYGFKRKISDFQHAVLLLGFNQVYQLVMDIGLRNTMPKTPAFRELLFHSMVVSFVSFEIAQICNIEKAVAVSTTGLLHDVGKSVIMLLKGKYAKMEFLIDLMDSAKLGALLLKEWNIPEVVSLSLEYQNYPEWLPPERIPEEHRGEVSVLYLAHLCYDFLRGQDEDDLPTTFLPEYLGMLNRPEKSIREMVKKMVLPALKKKQKSFPEDVRDFIEKGEQLLSDKAGVASPPSAQEHKNKSAPKKQPS